MSDVSTARAAEQRLIRNNRATAMGRVSLKAVGDALTTLGIDVRDAKDVRVSTTEIIVTYTARDADGEPVNATFERIWQVVPQSELDGSGTGAG